ncbi:MAG: D-aminoacyl-tRNA deacylase [Candidatus Bathyarchaeota archaeon]|nr:D-aminoacyl-tRNA deacylase [Candidatus Bathyarchaeota archaeon]
MFLIVASTKDAAGLNIKKQILTLYPFNKTEENHQNNPIYEATINNTEIKLVTINEEPVQAQNLLDFFPNPKLVIFISRHSSLSGKPTLSVHTPGNLSDAVLGGIPKRVSISPANAMKTALKTMAKLKEERQLAYEVSYECTHHGPSLDAPTMFAELGSAPAQWHDSKAAEVVAHAVIKASSKFNLPSAVAVLGIGGPHYNSRFTHMALEEETAFGHMIPKHAIAEISTETLRHCVERTLEKVECAILDWKGIKGENKQPLIRMLEEVSLGFKKT